MSPGLGWRGGSRCCSGCKQFGEGDVRVRSVYSLFPLLRDLQHDLTRGMAGFNQAVRVGRFFERQDMAYVNLERALLEQGRAAFK
jgi:hypothetical protein